MKNLPLALTDIRSFRAIDDKLATAGQPTGNQFTAISQAGFDVILNLALPTSDNAIANEGSIVTGLGMTYAHVPVDFRAPSSDDFDAFCGLMKAFEGRRVFVHCAANMRVSAFVFLHRVLHQNVSRSEAERDLRAIWEPDEVWNHFIESQLKNISSTIGL